MVSDTGTRRRPRPRPPIERCPGSSGPRERRWRRRAPREYGARLSRQTDDAPRPSSRSAVRRPDRRSKRGTVSQIAGRGSFPIWTPDGTRIVFSNPTGEVLWVAADGSDNPQPLVANEQVPTADSVAPDGASVAYTVRSSRGCQRPHVHQAVVGSWQTTAPHERSIFQHEQLQRTLRSDFAGRQVDGVRLGG